MNNFKDLIRQVREKWEYTGKFRPDFAVRPARGQESVWDYPRPPKIDSDDRHVVVKHKDYIIAETSKAERVLETASPPVFYIPPEDINMDILKESPGSSFCEWKGEASYWSFKDANIEIKNIGWSYPNPFREFKSIKDYIAFYPSRVDCFVEGEKVKSQPGQFYGGWITSELVGPFKGEIGTETW